MAAKKQKAVFWLSKCFWLLLP